MLSRPASTAAAGACHLLHRCRSAGCFHCPVCNVCLSASLLRSAPLCLFDPFSVARFFIRSLGRSEHSAPSSGASDAGPVVNPDPPRHSPPVRHFVFCVSLIRRLSLRFSPLLIVPCSRSPLFFALAFLSRSPIFSCVLVIFVHSRSLFLCASFLLFSHCLIRLLLLLLVFLIPTLVLFPFLILALHATSILLQLLLFLSPLPLLHTLLIVRVLPLVLLYLIFLLFFTSLLVPTFSLSLASFHPQFHAPPLCSILFLVLLPIPLELSDPDIAKLSASTSLSVLLALLSLLPFRRTLLTFLSLCTSNFVFFINLVSSPSSSCLCCLSFPRSSSSSFSCDLVPSSLLFSGFPSPPSPRFPLCSCSPLPLLPLP